MHSRVTMEGGESTRENLLGKSEAGNGEGGADSAVTSVLVFSVLVASCGPFVCGSAAGYTSPVESALMSELNLSKAEFSLIGSLCTAGGLLGAIINGKITDRLGRKGAMGVTAISCLLGWLAIAFSQAAWSLYLGRLLLGAGLGLTSYAVPTYAAEITPKNLRGRAVFTFMFFMCCGTTWMFFIGLLVNWRTLALISAIPCITQICALPFIPETPRWLLKVGREREFEASLQRLRGNDVDISEEAAEIKEYTEALQNIRQSTFLDLMQRKYMFSLILGLGLMALSQLSGATAMIFYANHIFESAGFSTTVGSVGMAIVQVPATTVGLLLTDKLGRRPLLILSASGFLVACLFSGSSFLLKEHGWMTNISPNLVFIGMMLFCISFPMGLGGIPVIIMSEVFPINIKGIAGSLATFIGSLAAWIMAFSFYFMLEWSSAGTFFIFAFVNAITILFAVKLLPETKGRTLEEIQESLTHTLHKDKV